MSSYQCSIMIIAAFVNCVPVRWVCIGDHSPNSESDAVCAFINNWFLYTRRWMTLVPSHTSVANCDSCCRMVPHHRFRLFTLRSYFVICDAHCDLCVRKHRSCIEKRDRKKLYVSNWHCRNDDDDDFDPEFSDRYSRQRRDLDVAST